MAATPRSEQPPHKAPTFVADCHLGKLAKYLRVLGLDTLYYSHIDDDDLIAIANRDGRIILTRDRELCERKEAPCYLFRTTHFNEQLRIMVREFHLNRYNALFSRCIVCNTPLIVVDKAEVIDRLPPKVAKFFDHFEQCETCDRIYWHGDHYKKMKAFIEEVLSSESK